mmetsp:Transcript_49666/g.116769  ORF Transcript_49666/g.116769 Transcript_49666/m.116769 type:complete len:230 (+) Transcript_49666:221-910(+)
MFRGDARVRQGRLLVVLLLHWQKFHRHLDFKVCLDAFTGPEETKLAFEALRTEALALEHRGAKVVIFLDDPPVLVEELEPQMLSSLVVRHHEGLVPHRVRGVVDDARDDPSARLSKYHTFAVHIGFACERNEVRISQATSLDDAHLDGLDEWLRWAARDFGGVQEALQLVGDRLDALSQVHDICDLGIVAALEAQDYSNEFIELDTGACTLVVDGGHDVLQILDIRTKL